MKATKIIAASLAVALLGVSSSYAGGMASGSTRVPAPIVETPYFGPPIVETPYFGPPVVETPYFGPPIVETPY